MLALIDFLGAIATNGRTEGELTSAEQDDLESIIAGQYDRSATWAQNLLCFYYDRCLSPLTGGDSQPKSRPVRQQPVAGAECLFLSIAPNPATTWSTFTYMLPQEAKDAYIEVSDAQGRSIEQFRIIMAQGQLVWDTRSKAPGVYSVELYASGKRLQTERLVINP